MLGRRIRKAKFFTLILSAAIWIAPANPALAQSGMGTACDNHPLCADTTDFVAVVTSFRTSTYSVYKVLDVTVRFQNKGREPLILGYVADSGIATDDHGNRYRVYGKKAYEGIGLVAGATFDPRFVLRPAASGDAQFELMWRPSGHDIYGLTFALDLTVDRIKPVGPNQYALGAEFPLHFQGLTNGASGKLPLINLSAPLASVQAAMSSPCNTELGKSASTASNTANAVSAIGSIFKRKKTAQPANAASGCPPAAAGSSLTNMAETVNSTAEQAKVDTVTTQAAIRQTINTPAAYQATTAQNSAQSLKDIWHRAIHGASQPAQQKPAQPQPQGSQQTPTVQSAANGPDPASPGSAIDFGGPPAVAGNFGKIADYRKMPDIVGIHLGMSPQQAYAVLRQEAGGSRIDPLPASLPILGYLGKETTMQAWLVNTGEGCQPSHGQEETYDVQMTFPPNPQAVWRVVRCLRPKQQLNKGQLLAGLRKKYGKEGMALSTTYQPTTDDRQIRSLFWFFDEAGQPAPAPDAGPAPLNVMAECFGNSASDSAAMASDVRDFETKAGRTYRMTPWCTSQGVAVFVHLDGDANLVYNVSTFMYDVPLAMRSLRATHDWWRATLAKRQQDEIEQSKQQKTKF